MVKKDVKSKVVAKKCCDGRLMVKILITTIQVNFGAAWSWHKIHLNCRY